MPFSRRLTRTFFGLACFRSRFREAADIAAQRLKAVEHCAVRGGEWRNAQYMELITTENRGSIATPADLCTIQTERRSNSRLMPDPNSGDFWKGRGRGRHGRYGL